MVIVTQVVNRAQVSLQGRSATQRGITRGLIAFLGISKTDTEKEVDKLVSKLIKLRVFSDSNQKMNLDIQTVKGEILLISQFTLLGNSQGNNRPSFSQAADKTLALHLYELFADKLKAAGVLVKKGYFGEHMSINLNLDGPITIILESDKI